MWKYSQQKIKDANSTGAISPETSYTSSKNNIPQTINNSNGKKQSGGSGRFSLKIQNVDEHKQKQLDIVQATNPMNDDYHTGIRTVDEYYGPYAQEFRAESCIFYTIYSMPVVFI